MPGDLAEGVYEALRTAGLDRRLSELPALTPRFAPVDSAEAPEVFARHVADVVRRVVALETDPTARIEIVNAVLRELAASEEEISGEVAEQLVVLTRQIAPGVHAMVRPETPLSSAALLTNAQGEPSLGAELRAELTSADRVDLLCAFIRWHGLRVLEEPLTNLRERGIPLRVITTTYIGATERRAVDELVRRFGAQVRISYESQSTRLHAKAWLLRRFSGYDTAYVGSSNLSRAALLDGLEWNVRLSGVATPELLRKFSATFDSYWADQAFVPYDPDTDGDRLDDELSNASAPQRRSSITLAGLEVRPLPHQVGILEALEAERAVHDRHRNLVVAATGTGKTVVAALDYRRLRDQNGEDLTLLFVAHRAEILEQSMRTYRETVADGSFGEAWFGQRRPERGRHIFASVQSLGSYGVTNLPADHFDVVVIDEFHHASAPTYRRILDYLRPRELLGLTATPERADGQDVRDYFGGRTAYELRLWDALAADLLVPFHYFGIADDVDLTAVEWKRGAYDEVGLDRLFTGNDARAAKIIRELQDKVTDIGSMRALGFCVSVAHARYMARVFTEAGISSLAVSAETRPEDRAAALAGLRDLEVNCLFAVDLFNEGLDIPEIDTVLMLRPTKSATIFLQQLGRGLRRAHNKAVLTVLDMIGQQRREFRMDLRYRALTGSGRKLLERQVEEGFPYLPSGSQIVLDRVSRDIVLANIRAQLGLTRRQLAADLRSHGDLPLDRYLDESGRDLADVYRNNGSWSALRREANLVTGSTGPNELALLRRMSALTHVDDPERARVYSALASVDGPGYEDLSQREQRVGRMLFFLLWPNGGGFSDYSAGFAHLREHPAVCSEICEVVTLGVDRARHVAKSLGQGLQNIPVLSHALYRREEILAGLDWARIDRKPQGHQSGVEWCEAVGTDAFLVTLRKAEREFSPNTMYRDYAISPDLFHWESQNSTALSSSMGKRYIGHEEMGSRICLFVREARENDIGAGAPFMCLGQASYVAHQGERPIAITWRLARPMPGDTFQLASVVGQ